MFNYDSLIRHIWSELDRYLIIKKKKRIAEYRDI